MAFRLGQLAATLCLLALASVAAARDLFGPPPGDPPPHEPVRVAATPGVGAPGQPVVGRFGLLPPVPLPAAPVYDLPPPPASRPPAEGVLPEVPRRPHQHDPRAREVVALTSDFSADALFAPYDGQLELAPYNDKNEIAVQRPLIEWGRKFYGPGPTPLGGEEFGTTNLTLREFYVYGDYRVAFAQNDLVNSANTVFANRLNLEADYRITATERFHAFVSPLQRDADFTRIEDGEFIDEIDFFQADTDSAFFEGDLGQILGGLRGEYAAFDLPVTVGLIPLLYQNGIWALDTVVGAAVTLPAKNDPALDWSNFDVTLFTALDRISTDAFAGDQDGPAIFGATTFIESRGGYLELGYAFVADQEGADRSYHNLSASYTRRYANLVSNSVRLIVNAGQDPDAGVQTADGALLLIENTFLTKNPYNVLPYVNVWAGFDRPQPLARAGVFGGVLFNTGILFQSDQLTGFPALDAFAQNTYGAAVGVDLLGPNFDQQLIVETAALGRIDSSDSSVAGNQVGVGVRWQKSLSTATLIRADAMIGLLDNSDDIHGARVEYRWKF